MAQLGVPLPLVYWDRPWSSAHVTENCPVFVQEWAGRDFKHPRKAKSVRQAARHTKGLCKSCWIVYHAAATGRAVVHRGGATFLAD